jgi:hypothetical protein
LPPIETIMTTMTNTIEIEDIEEMRRQQGIDDIELRAGIRCLRVGDFVRLTFRASVKSCETVSVRITRIRDRMTFRGKLVKRALKMPVGTIVEFTMAHVHSIVKRN